MKYLLVFIFLFMQTHVLFATHVTYHNPSTDCNIHSTTYLFQSSDGFIWLSGYNKICKWDGSIFQYYNSKDGYQASYITTMTETKQHSILIGALNGLFLLHGNKFYTLKGYDTSVHENIFCLIKLSDGNYLASTNNGYFIFDIDSCNQLQVKENVNLHTRIDKLYEVNKHTYIGIKNGDELVYIDSNKIVNVNWRYQSNNNHVFKNICRVNNKYYTINNYLWEINLKDFSLQKKSNELPTGYNYSYVIHYFQGNFYYGWKDLHQIDTLGNHLSISLDYGINGIYNVFSINNILCILTNHGFATIAASNFQQSDSTYSLIVQQDKHFKLLETNNHLLIVNNTDAVKLSISAIEKIIAKKIALFSDETTDLQLQYFMFDNHTLIVSSVHQGLFLYDLFTFRLTPIKEIPENILSLYQYAAYTQHNFVYAGLGSVIIYNKNKHVNYIYDTLYQFDKTNILTKHFDKVLVFTNTYKNFVISADDNFQLIDDSVFPKTECRYSSTNTKGQAACYFDEYGIIVLPEKDISKQIVIPYTDIGFNLNNIVVDDQLNVYAYKNDILFFAAYDAKKHNYKIHKIRYPLSASENQMYNIHDVNNGKAILIVGENNNFLIPKQQITSLINTYSCKPYIQTIKFNQASNEEYAKKIFHYTHNQLSIHVGAIDFTNLKEHYYQYAITELDKSFTITNNPYIQYNNLAPGKYTLLIGMANTMNLSSNPLIKYQFIIEAPWWQNKLLIIGLLILLIILTIGITQTVLKKIQDKKNIVTQQRMQLLMLESSARMNQIKPHFIFNALIPLQRYISNLNVEKSLQYLQQFSSMVRDMLHISRMQTTSLYNEIKYLDNYIQIRQREGSHNFTYKIKETMSPIDSMRIEMPTLISQPFIENAIDYGMIHPHHNHIDISFSLIDKDVLLLAVIDTGSGFEYNKIKSESSETSHAIDIIKERLQLLHPTNPNPIRYIKHPNSFEVNIYIPIKNLKHDN